ncbi:hypothetical protein [Streptomyces sp. 4N124]|uniref:hypothetical protein n=1 Tax=Streptomyces sp. 4N124 TaxID=3457420 RepID=UPI003FD13FD7
MAALTVTTLPRHRSTLARVALVADHLPADVSAALQALQQSRSNLDRAEQAFAAATPANWHQLDDEVQAAREADAKVVDDFVKLSAASSGAIRDSAAAAFADCIERANASIHAALEALTEAGQACTLYHSVKPGRAIVNIEGVQGEPPRTNQRISIVRGELRDSLAGIPDSVD